MDEKHIKLASDDSITMMLLMLNALHRSYNQYLYCIIPLKSDALRVY